MLIRLTLCLVNTYYLVISFNKTNNNVAYIWSDLDILCQKHDFKVILVFDD